MASKIQKKKPIEKETHPEVLDNLDTRQLKQAMLKEMYVLEASLFNQASLESNRITKLRSMIDSLQKIAFSDENIFYLEPSEKVAAYKTLSSNLHDSLQFMMNLQKTVGGGFEILDQIEQKREKKEVKTIDTKNEKNLQEIKSLILNKLKEKE